jgi:hypothetical protein
VKVMGSDAARAQSAFALHAVMVATTGLRRRAATRRTIVEEGV